MADLKIHFYRKFCLLTMIFLICYFVFQPATAQTTITVIPSDSNIMAGENIDIDISVNTDQTFVGAQMKIRFDSSLVSTTELEEGNLYSNSGLFYMFNTGTIDNSHGSINDIFAVTLGGGGISNDGNFIHIDMTAGNTSGVCNIHLENVIFSNSEGIPIPVIVRNANIISVFQAIWFGFVLFTLYWWTGIGETLSDKVYLEYLALNLLDNFFQRKYNFPVH